MKIWQLTQVGKRLARSTRSPDTDGWRIVHFLDRVTSATPDQIADGTGLSPSQVSLSLVRLRNMNPPVATELSHGSF